MDFVMGLLVSTNWKGESYDSILIIIDWLTIMVHYELVKVTIDALGLTGVILDMVVGTTACLTQLCLIEACYSSWSFDHYSVTSLTLNASYQARFILK